MNFETLGASTVGTFIESDIRPIAASYTRMFAYGTQDSNIRSFLGSARREYENFKSLLPKIADKNTLTAIASTLNNMQGYYKAVNDKYITPGLATQDQILLFNEAVTIIEKMLTEAQAAQIVEKATAANIYQAPLEIRQKYYADKAAGILPGTVTKTPGIPTAALVGLAAVGAYFAMKH
jgi:hypothetical protein